MNNKINIDIFQQDEFYDISFSDLKLDAAELKNKLFENCTFTRSSFIETLFHSCKFVDCEFKLCNLSSVQFKYTSFSDTVFDESKLIGINWTQAKWPNINLTSPIKIYKSNISHSSFFELELREIIIEECKAHDVDFRGCDLSNGIFILTDFQNSLFMHSKLYAANFMEAINYNINPKENDIRKGKYSMPDVINLLHHFEIEIEGI
ncbi:pentapeptide repeat-containing protein [Legionella maioricensis]|uniref:Pentapeptide repeat-containing protein n=1 Tax=Legionella maioricensis TaxID=2896528 RepID=A0A9X2D060_9GAMM|nr:pentapeptide repeat-containing protein [Legionella maioricensis]MCL9683655.1 pentapeptide repeat-containing protein [Legionella maioricensis]MCL9687677.1 pentapeptide repeat-containing protein [Legionella maioricensis]